MNQPNSKAEKPKDQRRFSQEQYDFLIECSKKGEEGINEWNEWREKKENLYKDIELDGIDPSEKYLKGIHLQLKGVEHIGEWSERKTRSDVYLRRADLSWAHLEGAELMNAHLEGAKLYFSHLENADLSNAHLENAECQRATVDGNTSLWECKVDRMTDFLGVSLDIAKIDPSTKQRLEYNIRRKNWEQWYKNEDEPIRHGVFIFSNKKIRLKTNKILRLLVRKFWEISDYGISTKQIIKTFFQLVIIFAGAYLGWGLIDYHLIGIKDNPGIVSNLFVLESNQEFVSPWLVPIRAVYFSIVTMTTLGFGDMYANAHSFIRGLFGHVLLAFQVILGYVLLGALVTRFAVLFTAGGPAGKFADEKGEKDEKQRRN